MVFRVLAWFTAIQDRVSLQAVDVTFILLITLTFKNQGLTYKLSLHRVREKSVSRYASLYQYFFRESSSLLRKSDKIKQFLCSVVKVNKFDMATTLVLWF